MMAVWPADDVIAYVRKGLKLFIDEHGLFPTLRLTSLQPPNPESARLMAEKIHRINDVLDAWRI
jgi:hypothetical protein